MRFSKYPKGTVFEVSVDNPKEFSVEDIQKYLELSNCGCLDKQHWSEFISVKRSLANAVGCPDANIKVCDDTLIITLL